MIGWALCQLCVVALWVPFRAQTLDATMGLWRAMLGIGVPLGAPRQWLYLAAGICAFLLVHCGEEFVLGTRQRAASIRATWQKLPAVARGGLAASLLAVLALFLKQHTTFIYFRF
jgi:hypothetical protein